MDSAKIGSVINRDLAGKVLDRAFPGKPHLAYFAFATEAVPSPGEVFDDAGKARTAGYLVDKAQLEEMTGYKLEKIETPTADALATAPQLRDSSAIFNKRSVSEASDESELKKQEKQPSAILAAFAADMSPAGKAVKDLLNALESGADVKASAASLVSRLPSLLPKDPETAAVISRAMAEAFGVQIKNVVDDNGASHSDANGQFDGGNGGAGVSPAQMEHKPATPDQVSSFQKNLPDKISAEDFDALLTAGFTDKDGAGNSVKYGTLLRDHWSKDGHSTNDINARKSKLGVAVKMVRETKPIPSNDPKKPNERVYFGLVDGKAYLAVADEHNEIGSMEMVSYRRHGRKDVR